MYNLCMHLRTAHKTIDTNMICSVNEATIMRYHGTSLHNKKSTSHPCPRYPWNRMMVIQLCIKESNTCWSTMLQEVQLITHFSDLEFQGLGHKLGWPFCLTYVISWWRQQVSRDVLALQANARIYKLFCKQTKVHRNYCIYCFVLFWWHTDNKRRPALWRVIFGPNVNTMGQTL